MPTQRLVLLNTSILTAYGTFSYAPVTVAQAQHMVADYQSAGREIISAIGHPATAELLSVLLEFPVIANRIEFCQTAQDTALVFKLRGRVPEGKILDRAELEALGYDFGLMRRNS